MKMRSQVKFITKTALFVALAMVLSYIERFIPTLPLPGFKLGLANIVTVYVLYNIGLTPAVMTVLGKLAVSLLLFGNVSAFFFSLFGSALSLAALVFSRYVLRNVLSFVGASALSAASHSLGQMAAAVCIYGRSVTSYLPLLLFISTVYGAITGILLNSLGRREDIKRLLSLALTVGMLLPLCSCERDEGFSEETFLAMDTYMSVRIVGGKKRDREELVAKCRDTVLYIESVASAEDEKSLVYSFNSSEKGADIGVDCAEMVRMSLTFSEMTDGAFDITVRPLTVLWNVTGGGPVPSEAEIRDALSHVGYEKISLEGTFLHKSDKETEIDLGAVAKGYALDKVYEILKGADIDYAVVNFGGNVALVGDKGGGFRVGITDPSGVDETIGRIETEEGFVSVSGGYERYFTENGVSYHHIIDPRTGHQPSGKDTPLSVAVYTGSAMAGDILSTALFVMGKEKALSLYDRTGDFEALIFTENETVATEKIKNSYSES